jgi:hypothetical protein
MAGDQFRFGAISTAKVVSPKAEPDRLFLLRFVDLRLGDFCFGKFDDKLSQLLVIHVPRRVAGDNLDCDGLIRSFGKMGFLKDDAKVPTLFDLPDGLDEVETLFKD